jgi:chondroitin 4-sulfotransferase 11
MESTPRSCLFIPVNKCACTSMTAAIKGHPAALIVANRSFLLEREIHRDEVTMCMWEQSFSFAFIRNPFDRLVSAWCMFREKYGVSFEEVLDIALDHDLGHRAGAGRLEEIKRHTLPLSHPHYGLVDASGVPRIDFIGRFERLYEDWCQVCRSIGAHLTLPHLNRTKHVEYTSYYDRRLRSRAELIYSTDMEIFGYSF